MPAADLRLTGTYCNTSEMADTLLLLLKYMCVSIKNIEIKNAFLYYVTAFSAWQYGNLRDTEDDREDREPTYRLEESLEYVGSRHIG